MAEKIVVLGAGESGVGSAVLAQKKGFDVWVSDKSAIKQKYKDMLVKYNIPFEEQTHSEDKILDADEVIKSPGIPESADIIKKIRAKGIHIISEIEFAGRYTSAKTICITGSNGKTTTTMLTYFILSHAGYNVGLAGNVGKSFALQVAEDNYDYYVIELSSFQLDGMYDFRADVAVLMNITPDHLDRYNYEFQNYIDSKFRILQNLTQEQYFVFWSEDPVIKKELAKRDVTASLAPFGVDKENNVAWVDDKNLNVNYMNSFSLPIDDIYIKGIHNLYNSMAASLAASVVGVSSDVIRQALKMFKGVEHRLEYVDTINGVRYINDSKATNIDSCWYALHSMTTPTVLILGGTDKGNDYNDILDLVKQKVHTLVFMGVDNTKLVKFFSENSDIPFVDTHSLKDAVDACFRSAKNGDTVLLSPCCASFDLFKNYENRGELFKEEVRRIKNSL